MTLFQSFSFHWWFEQSHYTSSFEGQESRTCRWNRGNFLVSVYGTHLWIWTPRAYRQRFVTNGKHRTRQLQNRLRGHTNQLFCGMKSLPVDPLRKFTFKALRLSGKGPRNQSNRWNSLQSWMKFQSSLKWPNTSRSILPLPLSSDFSETFQRKSCGCCQTRLGPNFGTNSRPVQWAFLQMATTFQFAKFFTVKCPVGTREDIYYNAEVEMNYLLINRKQLKSLQETFMISHF